MDGYIWLEDGKHLHHVNNFDLRWNVSEMPLRVTSVNLAADWPDLRASLLNLPTSGS